MTPKLLTRRTVLGALMAGSATAFLAACATPATPAANGANAPAALPAEISIEEAARLREAGAFVLDVREPYEYAEEHIDGATLIPLGELPARLSEVPRDKQVVVVCRSGNRSQSGRDVLRNAGFSSVASMTGGLIRWNASGKPLVAGQ